MARSIDLPAGPVARRPVPSTDVPAGEDEGAALEHDLAVQSLEPEVLQRAGASGELARGFSTGPVVQRA